MLLVSGRNERKNDMKPETSAMFNLANQLDELARANAEECDEIEGEGGDIGTMEHCNGRATAYEYAARCLRSLATQSLHGTL